MRVLSIVSTKGGVGKTTLTVHLAVAAHTAGQRVLVLDLDQQGSAVQWWKDRQRTIAERQLPAGERFDVRRADARNLPATVDAAAGEGFDLTIIDTPPHADFPAARAVEVADLVLMPSRPGYFDLHAAKPTIKLIQQLEKRAFFVMNQVPHNSPGIGADASDFLEVKGIKRPPLTITLLQPYVRCLRDGLTAPELVRDGRHAIEIGELWRWTHVQLDISLCGRARVADSSPKSAATVLGDPFAEFTLPPLGEGAA